MRQVTIRTGNYAGKHPIYSSMEEAQEAGITPKEPWHGENVQTGDWIVSDDGYILQLLRRSTLRNKNKNRTDIFRTVNGTSFVYYRVDGSKHIRRLLGGEIQVSKGRMSNRMDFINDFKARRNFIKLAASEMPLKDAFGISYPYLKKSPKANKFITTLIEDNQIFKAILKEMKMDKFMAKIENEILTRTNSTLTDNIANRIVDLITSKDVKVQNIKFAIELFGEELGIVKPKTNQLDADYSMIPPEELTTNQGSESNEILNLPTYSYDFIISLYSYIPNLHFQKIYTSEMVL